jgi:hypothetical protein
MTALATPPHGLFCPRCGATRLKTCSTMRLPGHTRRYRQCAACGKRVTTYEVTARGDGGGPISALLRGGAGGRAP